MSHAYALGQIDPAYQDRLGAGLAAAGITLTTAAVFDFPVPPINGLRAAGVNIACGHDGIRDLWSPSGSGDWLERAMHVACRSTFRRDEDIEIAWRRRPTTEPARPAWRATGWRSAPRPTWWYWPPIPPRRRW